MILIIGFYSSILLIGLNPSVLAGAGILAVAFAFLSRNLLEDMLNGILILWTDRYAIGDVIDINGMGGLVVENINLFVTSLRNLDGQVIAIPNSKISTVVNHTKDWSRVNFTIKIAWHENIKRAIEIMMKVADEMESEAQWKHKFLEPLEVLGVDEVSHEGILIHLLIKTKPSEHWSVGREFRLRVKEAFDQENIMLGIPHHTVSLINKSNNEDQLLSYIVPEQDN
ncbi:mechanosensitive ion channel family protein [Crocosphaera sp. Alani8]|uniref:mechanosensitive ion channel family protein n=1 Tax=Crocosphaera sp. Alani8 TaxID=3038952 RepID=UPI00313BF780